MAAAVSSELAPLVGILSKEQSVYQQLLAVAEEERAAIVDGALLKLKDALERKQQVLQRLAILEERRVQWVQRYARRHGLDVQVLTLAEIVNLSAPPEAAMLRRLHARLRDSIERLSQMNDVTKNLLENVLRSIDQSLRFLLADDVGPTYGAQGRLQTGPLMSRQLIECQA